MAKPTVVLSAGRTHRHIGALSLVERGVLLAERAGLPVRVVGELPDSSQRRLRSRGVDVVVDGPGRAPLAAVEIGAPAIVVAPDVLFGPEVLASLLELALQSNAAVFAGENVAVLYLPHVGVELQRAPTIEAILVDAAAGPLQPVNRGRMYCRRIESNDRIAPVTREYIRHLNGRGEAYFTKRIRRYSVPLSERLAAADVKPATVTFIGLLLATVSAWSISQGSYTAGVAGAVAYYASMVCDCSDGEVARVTLRDSPFGAWLETVVDYATYFFLLGALFAVSQASEHAGLYRIATFVALAGSIVVVAMASYLRRRVAGADPGQFDDASAAALATSGPLHRFAKWGRQWIKRSTLAHLVVALALVGALPVLILLWAFGATVGAIVILAVEPFVVRTVSVGRGALPGPH
jgi:phosphatidylglycerophosphate synthase